MLSKEDLLVMSYSRSKATGDREITQGTWGRRMGVTSGLGEGAGGQEGLTLGISVISVGDTVEPLLPGRVPDLGRNGQTIKGSRVQKPSWAEGTHAVV